MDRPGLIGIAYDYSACSPILPYQVSYRQGSCREQMACNSIQMLIMQVNQCDYAIIINLQPHIYKNTSEGIVYDH